MHMVSFSIGRALEKRHSDLVKGKTRHEEGFRVVERARMPIGYAGAIPGMRTKLAMKNIRMGEGYLLINSAERFMAAVSSLSFSLLFTVRNKKRTAARARAPKIYCDGMNTFPPT